MKSGIFIEIALVCRSVLERTDTFREIEYPFESISKEFFKLCLFYDYLMRISKDNYKKNILNNYYMLDVWAKCFMGIILL